MTKPLFTPIRTLGLVCNRLPVFVFDQGTQTFVAASTGSSVQIYNADNLRIVFSSRPFPAPITALTCDVEQYSKSKRWYVATTQNYIYARNAHRDVWQAQVPDLTASLEIFGPWLLCFHRNGLIVLSVESGTIINSFTESLLDIAPLGGQLGRLAILHHAGISNKYLLGGASGLLQEFDVKSGQVAKTYRCVQKTLIQKLQEFNKYLTTHSLLDDWVIDSLTDTGLNNPASLIAISSTRSEHYRQLPPLVMLLDEESNDIICTLVLSKEQGRVNTLAFKDRHPEEDPNKPGSSVIAYLGCENGDIVLFSLDSCQILSTLKAAHADELRTTWRNAGVTNIHTLSSGGVCGCLFLSSGTDNSIRVWHIEDLKVNPTILRQRRGFGGTIGNLRFYDANDEAKDLLVTANMWKIGYEASSDSYSPSDIFAAVNQLGKGEGNVGKISYILSQQDSLFPVSKALKSINAAQKLSLKCLPPVVAFDFNPDRHYDWPCVATCHSGLREVFLWSAHTQSLMPAVLTQARKPEAESEDFTITTALVNIAKLKNEQGHSRVAAAVGVAISQCGHFAVIGYKNGHIHHFNLQSRRPLGAYIAGVQQNTALGELEKLALAAVQETNTTRAFKKQRILQAKIAATKKVAYKSQEIPPHNGPVKYLNILQSSEVYSASDAVGDLRILRWHLRNRTLIDVIDLKDFMESAAEYRISNLSFDGNLSFASISNDNYSHLLVVNLYTKDLVRMYGPFDGFVVQSALSPLGNWVAVATANPSKSTDGELRVFDIINNRLIEWIQYSAPLSAFAFHPSGAFLITAHAEPRAQRLLIKIDEDSLESALFPRGALYIWANLALFSQTSDVQQKAITNPRRITLPPIALEDVNVDCNIKDDKSGCGDWKQLAPMPQQNPTLESDPRWPPVQLSRLLNWDALREQSERPVVISKESTEPFFLFSQSKVLMPVVNPHEPLSQAADAEVTETKADPKIETKELSSDAGEVLETLLASNIPHIHLFIIGLTGSSVIEFAKYLARWSSSTKAVDFVQVIVALYIKSHGHTLLDLIPNHKEELKPAFEAIHRHSTMTWTAVGQTLNALICYLKLATLMQFD